MTEPPDLRAIVARASTVDERLKACCAASGPLDEFDKAVQQKRFAAWRRLWRSHPPAVFARRLAANEDKAAAILSRVEPIATALLPPWGQALAWIASAVSEPLVDRDGLTAGDTP
jgi:hypothetical protein